MQEPDASPQPYVAQVERAQAGELAAFGELVVAFQDMVVGTAFGWLGDIELARDVAQESFANAHVALRQLEEPAAFPGWLRRIVLKHCDRVTRRGRLEVATREPRERTASGPLPDAALEDRREAEQLRRAVEALPRSERLPLVLHYFAGEPQPALASFLELSLPSLKKRLRRARARLREAYPLPGEPGAPGSEENPMAEPTPLRPSRDPRFSAAVQFFLALRAGDHDEVARMLTRMPELVETEQRWDPELVYEGVLPFASRATPLVTAVERGDLDMTELLLARGAVADGRCGCATGESPLWAAVLLEEMEIVRRLLEAGADPNRRAATGNAPIHVAAMRGREDLVALLLEHGARSDLPDRAGRTARAWALAKGHAQVAARLPEREDEAPRPLAVPAGEARTSATGIRAVDLFVPLARGALVRVPFRAGCGMVVLLNELSHRWANRPDGAALWTGIAQGPFDPDDLRAELREAGLARNVAVHLAPRENPPDARRKTFAEGIDHAEELRKEGRDVLVVLLTQTGFEIDAEASFTRLRTPAPAGSMTTLVVSPFENQEEDGRSALVAPWDARVTLDRRRARRGLYPAVDPVGSHVRSEPGAFASPRHARVSERARALLIDYERCDPDLALPDPATIADADPEETARAQRLLRFLTQPFVTTEPFTGHPARPYPLPELLDRVEAILAGEAVPAEAELTPQGLARPQGDPPSGAGTS